MFGVFFRQQQNWCGTTSKPYYITLPSEHYFTAVVKRKCEIIPQFEKGWIRFVGKNGKRNLLQSHFPFRYEFPFTRCSGFLSLLLENDEQRNDVISVRCRRALCRHSAGFIVNIQVQQIYRRLQRLIDHVSLLTRSRPGNSELKENAEFPSRDDEFVVAFVRVGNTIFPSWLERTVNDSSKRLLVG